MQCICLLLFIFICCENNLRCENLPSDYEGEIPFEKLTEEEKKKDEEHWRNEGWTLGAETKDTRVFEYDDDEDEYKEEWEAPELSTTQPTRPPRTRRTWNYTRYTFNWTTRPRTSRKFFTGVTYNSSHCITEDPIENQFVEVNDVHNYISIEKSKGPRYHQLITYRTQQIKELENTLNDIKKEIERLKDWDDSFQRAHFNKINSDARLNEKLLNDINLRKSLKEMNIYETLSLNFKNQIKNYEKLNDLDMQINEFRKTTKIDTNKNEDSVIAKEREFNASLIERISILSTINSANEQYSDMLDKLELIKTKVPSKNEYEEEKLNSAHKMNLVKFDSTISEEEREKYIQFYERYIGLIADKMQAAQHYIEKKEEKYNQRYLNQSVKTNVIFDQYKYDIYRDRTLNKLGTKLRDLFNVTSLEYEDNTSEVNATDNNSINKGVTDIDTEMFHDETQPSNIIEHKNNDNYTHDCENMILKSQTNILNNIEQLYQNGSVEKSEDFMKFKKQHYNVHLANMHMDELKELEEYLDTVHDRINNTHTKFATLQHRLRYGMKNADSVDRLNYENIVKIYGIPKEFKTKYENHKNITEWTILERIGVLMQKRTPIKKIKQVYQQPDTTYNRPPLVVEFYHPRDKKRWIKEYMNFILIRPRKPTADPQWTKLKLRPRVIYLPYRGYYNVSLSHKYDRFIIRDELPSKMNNLMLRVKRKIQDKGMSKQSIVWHNNSIVFFRRHYFGKIRQVDFYGNLDKLFEESDEKSRNDEYYDTPVYKKTTSFLQRWKALKCKRKFLLRPTKKKTTPNEPWMKIKQKTTMKRKAIIKQHKIWDWQMNN